MPIWHIAIPDLSCCLIERFRNRTHQNDGNSTAGHCKTLHSRTIMIHIHPPNHCNQMCQVIINKFQLFTSQSITSRTSLLLESLKLETTSCDLTPVPLAPSPQEHHQGKVWSDVRADSTTCCIKACHYRWIYIYIIHLSCILYIYDIYEGCSKFFHVENVIFAKKITFAKL